MPIQSDLNEKYRYQIIRTKQNIEGVGEMESYGIACDSDDEPVAIPDITTDLETVSALLGLLNRNDVSAIHLRDIVEDYI